jgi:Putative transposase/Transposase zinc-binding domain
MERISTDTAKPTVADIIRRYGKKYEKTNPLLPEQIKAIADINRCRTPELGGDVFECEDCGTKKNVYHSCCNRHCPICQGLKRERWLDDRKAELLDARYFHKVLTLPHTLNPFILNNKKVMLDLLFQAVREVLTSFALDPQWRLKGELGVIAVLHTWSQTLIDHFHLHCLIPGGALSTDRKRWKKAGKKFLFRTESLAKAFRNRYLDLLDEAYWQGKLIFPGKTAEYRAPEVFFAMTSSLRGKKWVAYSKATFAGPEQVLEYLGRYTHRVAIANSRIAAMENDEVTFTYRDRDDGNTIKPMTLKADEFIRRFLLHVLPKGFVKIRYFGFLSHRKKKENLAIIRRLLGQVVELVQKVKESVKDLMLRLFNLDITRCPECNGRLFHFDEIKRRPANGQYQQAFAPG